MGFIRWQEVDKVHATRTPTLSDIVSKGVYADASISMAVRRSSITKRTRRQLSLIRNHNPMTEQNLIILGLTEY